MPSNDTSLQRLAQESLDIQDACNLCGLAQRFAVVMKVLRQQPDCRGTDWVNRHPITRMWLSKFEHLAGLSQSMPISDYEWVYNLAKGVTADEAGEDPNAGPS